MSLITRLKTLLAAVFVTASIMGSPAQSAGTIPLAMAQQVDVNGQPLAGCLVNLFVAGTVATPQNAFADFALTQSLGPVLTCDQAGRVPMFWLADGLIHVRLTDSSGGNIPVDTTMQVLGPSSGGGGGGGTVDPTSIMSTGDMKMKYTTGPLTGFVRGNGLTIGNLTSGATERANADTQALFIFLYNCGDATLVVSGGRTGNPLNDYNAGKTITLPDYAGRGIGALDDLGAGAKGRLTTTFFGPNPTVLGAAGGIQSHTQILAEVPLGITVSGTNTISVSATPTISSSGVNTINSTGSNSISVLTNSTHVMSSGTAVIVDFPSTAGSGLRASDNSSSLSQLTSTNPSQVINVSATPNISVSATPTISSTGANTITGTSTNTGGSPFATVSPMKLATIYIKL